jgi:organic hydroperoxide reductase OsmC/OhrA
MPEYHAEVRWERTTEGFIDFSYGRDHRWDFPGGQRLLASAAPEYQGSPTHVNPEEALVAAVSSCHMLTFLAIAARRKLVVDSYADAAVGLLEKNEQGRMAITRVELRPKVVFSSECEVDANLYHALHDAAHQNCFIANSIRAEVVVSFLDEEISE